MRLATLIVNKNAIKEEEEKKGGMESDEIWLGKILYTDNRKNCVAEYHENWAAYILNIPDLAESM